MFLHVVVLLSDFSGYFLVMYPYNRGGEGCH